MADVRPDFTDYLTRNNIRFDPCGPSGGFEVHGSLPLREPCDLPPHLSVHGTLLIQSLPAFRMPSHMVVHGNLTILKVPLTCLPATLWVSGNISLNGTRITALPQDFTCQGSLTLAHNPIEVLPEGLLVGEDLNIEHSEIRRLPRVLHVGRMIVPPPNFADIRAFMRGRSGVVLAHAGSQHQRMDTQALLAPYPDLLRIFDHMNADVQMTFERGLIWGYHLYFEPVRT